MPDDIVTRLRECVVGDPDEYTWWQTMTQAADEIERLRADRDRWKQSALDYQEHLERHGCDWTTTLASRSFYKAVRGE